MINAEKPDFILIAGDIIHRFKISFSLARLRPGEISGFGPRSVRSAPAEIAVRTHSAARHAPSAAL
jgi:hypothetical protein